ncbi:hypothetical protein UA08_05933 [Talaromyces atroroseus]|uniref:Pentatricopeptide repeat domain-containing protein n=1 Tax=Talaromyces atroroseus TaxID=1441469 RepID=A0A225AEW5_TALAT|nr:hypothetical protein UA08_05933 [Talaromyces atroroseus]OKL59100.1 hypothetical protein UA08_05933 [Talaromyces atroroseus]
MRPALLRLLKRPSAISLLAELVSTSGIERLPTSGKCLICQTRRAHAQPLLLHHNIPIIVQTDSPQKLQVHEITPTGNDEIVDGRINVQGTQKGDLPLSLDVDRLEYESALDRDEINDRKRLVDDPQKKHDFKLWKELLQYRKRRYGKQGVAEIWKGLASRRGHIQLPMDGKLADYFWETFVDAGLEDEQLLCGIAEYAEHIWSTTETRWTGFYEAVVGGFFAMGLPEQAVYWHRKLQPLHLGEPNDIALIIDQAVSCVPQKPPDWSLFSREAVMLGFRPGLRAFGEICLATEGHQIYETIIPFLLRRGHSLDAMYMHEFLVKRGDMPCDVDAVGQLLEFAEIDSHTFSRKVRERIRKVKPSLISLHATLATHGESESSTGTRDKPEATKDSPPPKNGEDDDDDWMRERTFKDEFGARLFATKALTVDMITNGLQMFGVQAIGPLSLREIALRADGPKDILEKMQALRKADITIRDCAFTRLVERLAVEHKDIVLEDLLHSDQHPDVLEDAVVQENFLCSYLMARDWRLYNLTKAILSEVAKDDLDNIQFRVSLAARKWSTASDIVDRMYLDGKVLSEQSINHMINSVLTPRLPGRDPPYPQGPDRNEVDYALRILKLAFRFQSDISPQYWVELLQRLGKHRHDQWERLRGLCLWLAQNYVAQNDSPLLHSLSRSTGVDPETLLAKNRAELRHIFNPRLQMALVTWGFKLSLWAEEQHEMPISDNKNNNQRHDGTVIRWLRGLVLLRELEAMGVTIYPSFVRQACRERLQVLYGELESARKWNRSLRQKNPFKLSHVLNDMLKIYPGLFTEEERLDLHKLIDRPLSSMAARRMQQQEEWQQQWPR